MATKTISFSQKGGQYESEAFQPALLRTSLSVWTLINPDHVIYTGA